MEKRCNVIQTQFEESEETEVKKDLEWAKDEVRQIASRFPTYHDERDDKIKKMASMHDVLAVLDQLDEPEVLSPDWIKDNQLMWTSIHGTEYYVPTNKLYGKIVPEQEITEEQAWEVIHGKYGDEVLQNNIDYVETNGYVVVEKPVIPHFVAEWFEENKENFESKLKSIIKYPPQYDEDVTDFTKWVSNPVNKPIQTLGNMFNGYEVEEEQKYYVELLYGVLALHQFDDYYDVFDKEQIEGNKEWVYQFTEQEIKDYDPRYFAFAVPVEELEE